MRRYDPWKMKRSSIGSETIWDDRTMRVKSTIRVVGLPGVSKAHLASSRMWKGVISHHESSILNKCIIRLRYCTVQYCKVLHTECIS